ncbi:Threonylcarbamoyl-AMP synthase [Halioglobus japonicus]|nr:Threonylcarbamoyl-AMP synthase [Halioglobus japonicus]
MSLPPSAHHLQTAVSTLREGGVIACPTEAVWGLSCDPDNEDAVTRLLALKGRPVAKGLILVAADQEQIDFLLSGLSDVQRQMLSDSWPGPATWLLPHRGLVPAWVTGSHSTVAVRVSSHPAVSKLCAAWGGPLVSTSANPAGASPAKEAYQVRHYFGDELDYLLPGRVGAAQRPTVIRDLLSGQIIRD